MSQQVFVLQGCHFCGVDLCACTDAVRARKSHLHYESPNERDDTHVTFLINHSVCVSVLRSSARDKARGGHRCGMHSSYDGVDHQGKVLRILGDRFLQLGGPALQGVPSDFLKVISGPASDYIHLPLGGQMSQMAAILRDSCDDVLNGMVVPTSSEACATMIGQRYVDEHGFENASRWEILDDVFGHLLNNFKVRTQALIGQGMRDRRAVLEQFKAELSNHRLFDLAHKNPNSGPTAPLITFFPSRSLLISARCHDAFMITYVLALLEREVRGNSARVCYERESSVSDLSINRSMFTTLCPSTGAYLCGPNSARLIRESGEGLTGREIDITMSNHSLHKATYLESFEGNCDSAVCYPSLPMFGGDEFYEDGGHMGTMSQAYPPPVAQVCGHFGGRDISCPLTINAPIHPLAARHRYWTSSNWDEAYWHPKFGGLPGADESGDISRMETYPDSELTKARRRMVSLRYAANTGFGAAASAAALADSLSAVHSGEFGYGGRLTEHYAIRRIDHLNKPLFLQQVSTKLVGGEADPRYYTDDPLLLIYKVASLDFPLNEQNPAVRQVRHSFGRRPIDHWRSWATSRPYDGVEFEDWFRPNVHQGASNRASVQSLDHTPVCFDSHKKYPILFDFLDGNNRFLRHLYNPGSPDLTSEVFFKTCAHLDVHSDGSSLSSVAEYAGQQTQCCMTEDIISHMGHDDHVVADHTRYGKGSKLQSTTASKHAAAYDRLCECRRSRPAMTKPRVHARDYSHFPGDVVGVTLDTSTTVEDENYTPYISKLRLLMEAEGLKIAVLTGKFALTSLTAPVAYSLDCSVQEETLRVSSVEYDTTLRRALVGKVCFDEPSVSQWITETSEENVQLEYDDFKRRFIENEVQVVSDPTLPTIHVQLSVSRASCRPGKEYLNHQTNSTMQSEEGSHYMFANTTRHCHPHDAVKGSGANGSWPYEDWHALPGFKEWSVKNNFEDHPDDGSYHLDPLEATVKIVHSRPRPPTSVGTPVSSNLGQFEASVIELFFFLRRLRSYEPHLDEDIRSRVFPNMYTVGGELLFNSHTRDCTSRRPDGTEYDSFFFQDRWVRLFHPSFESKWKVKPCSNELTSRQRFRSRYWMTQYIKADESRLVEPKSCVPRQGIPVRISTSLLKQDFKRPADQLPGRSNTAWLANLREREGYYLKKSTVFRPTVNTWVCIPGSRKEQRGAAPLSSASGHYDWDEPLSHGHRTKNTWVCNAEYSSTLPQDKEIETIVDLPGFSVHSFGFWLTRKQFRLRKDPIKNTIFHTDQYDLDVSEYEFDTCHCVLRPTHCSHVVNDNHPLIARRDVGGRLITTVVESIELPVLHLAAGGRYSIDPDRMQAYSDTSSRMSVLHASKRRSAFPHENRDFALKTKHLWQVAKDEASWTKEQNSIVQTTDPVFPSFHSVTNVSSLYEQLSSTAFSSGAGFCEIGIALCLTTSPGNVLAAPDVRMAGCPGRGFLTYPKQYQASKHDNEGMHFTLPFTVVDSRFAGSSVPITNQSTLWSVIMKMIGEAGYLNHSATVNVSTDGTSVSESLDYTSELCLEGVNADSKIAGLSALYDTQLNHDIYSNAPFKHAWHNDTRLDTYWSSCEVDGVVASRCVIVASLSAKTLGPRSTTVGRPRGLSTTLDSADTIEAMRRRHGVGGGRYVTSQHARQVDHQSSPDASEVVLVQEGQRFANKSGASESSPMKISTLLENLDHDDLISPLGNLAKLAANF